MCTDRRLATLTMALSLLGWRLSPVAAQPQSGPAAAPVDVRRLGPQLGERAPEFSLPDQTGVVRTLQSVMGPNGAMLVLYRSADW
jgi:hypothetical protein